MAKKIKFTDEEIRQINDLRLEVSGIFTQLGQISIEKKRRLDELNEKKNKLTTRHSELVTIEKTLFGELSKKYGDGNYNQETGEFTPINKKEENKEEEKLPELTKK